MDVRLPALGTRADADIAPSAETAISWIASVPNGAIRVLVERSWITLSGEWAQASMTRLGQATSASLITQHATHRWPVQPGKRLNVIFGVEIPPSA